MAKRVRRTCIQPALIISETGWAASAITFTEYQSNGASREVRVAIESPFILNTIQAQLDKVSAYWSKCLNR